MSGQLAAALLAELGDAELDQLAELLLPRMQRLAEPLTDDDGRLGAQGAAAYLATTRARIYDLVQLGKLQPQRDGRRLLFRRADLDSYLDRKP